MKITNNNIKQVVEKTMFIFLDAKSNFVYYKYLCKPDTVEESMVKSQPFILKIVRILWRQTVIELSKLFRSSKNEYYNIDNLLGYLIDRYEKCEWIRKMKKELLIKWQDTIHQVDFREIINKLLMQRDSYIAHTDRSPKKKMSQIKVSIEEVQKLINFCENMFKKFYEDYFESNLILDIHDNDQAGGILKIMASNFNVQDDKYYNEIKSLFDKRKNDS